MSLIKKPNELNVQTRIKMLIYGQAGTGKTTLALSAPNPLLIDFDGGVNRVNYAHLKDTVQVSQYEDLLNVLNNEDLSAYDTIIIDTGGKMLDSMAAYLIKGDSRLGRRNGMLTQNGYGQRKAEFAAVVKLINSKNKDVIFIAHRQTVNDGDDIRYVPLFGGSNYDSLVTELDLVGYLEANGRQRVITFDPTSRSDGKNTCNMPSTMEVPTILDANGNETAPNDFLTEQVIKRYRQRLVERIEESESYKKLMADLEKAIAKVKDADSANKFIESIDTYKHIGNSKTMAAKKFMARCTELGLKYDKETKTYNAPAAS